MTKIDLVGLVSEPTAVLVVDDEAAVASVLARALTYAGYDVTTAYDGMEALDRLEEKRFDVLLTDIHMPRLRGDEMQRLARKRHPDLAVLLITAAEEVTTAVECLKSGAFDYLTKPFDLSDVVVRVHKALERRRLIQENNDYRRNLERRVEEQAERLRRTLQGSLEALIHTLEAKDPNTRNHSTRVSELATQISLTAYPKETDFAAQVRIAGLFHDIGKIGVPEAVLHKNGPLTESEMEQIRRHPEIGETILKPLLEPSTVAMVRSHHEQWNGHGYPDRLVREAIPLGGRIIAVADAYDAMTSARPYRREIMQPYVIDILNKGAGIQWDSTAVAALIQIVAEGRLPAPNTANAAVPPPYVPISAPDAAPPG